jgi:AcrR family transcriptional regulator
MAVTRSKTAAEPRPEAKPGALRDRKKAKQRQALIDAAIGLFRDNSFEKTRIEDIAAVADVSVATVYNYFSTKQQILVEIVKKSTEDGQPAVLAVAQEPPRNPVEAIIALIKADFGDVDHEADKKLWRELLASMTRDQENRAQIEAVRAMFRDNLRQLLKLLVERGQLKAGTDIDALVDIAYAIYAYHFRQLVCLERMTTALTMKAIRRDLKTLLLGHRTD